MSVTIQLWIKRVLNVKGKYFITAYKENCQKYKKEDMDKFKYTHKNLESILSLFQLLSKAPWCPSAFAAKINEVYDFSVRKYWVWI